MYKKYTKFILTIYFLLTSFIIRQVNAQSISPYVLNSGGGTSSLFQNHQFDWSIAESSSIDSYSGSHLYSNSILTLTNFFTSGFLQPYDKISIIYNASLPSLTNEEVRLYPVPAIDYTILDFRAISNGIVLVQLYNKDGKLIQTKKVFTNNNSFKQKWDLSSLATGWYFFNITTYISDGSISKFGVFKFVKVN